MEQEMTIEEIESQFDSEWVLVGDPETNEHLEVLRGKVLGIGGVKEKVVAAHRAGLKTVVLPEENRPDLEEIPAEVRRDLKLELVGHMDQVLNLGLQRDVKDEKIEVEDLEIKAETVQDLTSDESGRVEGASGTACTGTLSYYRSCVMLK